MRTLHQLPEQFQMKNVAELTRQQPGLAVSIYMATNERRGHEIPQEPLILRQLVEVVTVQLAAKGWRSSEIADFLRPVSALAAPDQSFWPYQQRGLAIFLAEGFYAAYQLPQPCLTEARVGTDFWLRPLLPIMGADGGFYLLALSQKKVQLYQGTTTQWAPVTVPQLPSSLLETLRFDQFEHTLQFHSTSSSGMAETGRRAAIFHGQGDAGDERIKHQQLHRFLQEVAHAVDRYLADQEAPLFLAGVDFIQSIYRQHSRYGHLMAMNVPGNIDHCQDAELHGLALPLLHAYDAARMQRVLARYADLAPGRQTVAGVAAVTEEALRGNVDALLIAPLATTADAPPAALEVWGSIDPATGQATCGECDQPEAEELINYALVHTLRSGGAVYPVAPDAMPVDALAAILRY